MTYCDIKLDYDYGDDEICRAQNKVGSERVEEYTIPAICSFELDSPVKAKQQAIETYDKAFNRHGHDLNRMLYRQYLPYKMAVKTTPMKSNTRGRAAIGTVG